FASLPVCLRLMVKSLQLLLTSMLATLNFIMSLPSISAEQVAAIAAGAARTRAEAKRILRSIALSFLSSGKTAVCACILALAPATPPDPGQLRGLDLARRNGPARQSSAMRIAAAA